MQGIIHALLLVCAFTTAILAAGKPPNFVFMMADDFGYGDVRYNGGNADTPNIDEMASSPHSIRLNRYYSGGPVCSPTRGTVLTGRNHNRFCIWTANSGNDCDDFACPEGMPLPTSEITIAEILKEQGYETAIFGKWHLGDLKPIAGGNKKWPVSRPDLHGFNEWWVTERSAPTTDLNCACFNASACPLGHYTDTPPCTNYYSRDDELGVLLALTHPLMGDDPDFLVTLVEEFLQTVNKSGRPFFLYLPFHSVHIRYIASMRYIERYKKANYGQDEIDYYGAISAMDNAVGLIRDLLKKYNLSDDTMTWFVSDNGPQLGTPGSAGGFRGYKSELYEGGIRVPGIIEWPDMIDSNSISEYAVVSSDFLPTVCNILNISVPTDRIIDGTSILPLIKNERPTRNKTISWAFEIHDGDFLGEYHAAISGDRYKVFETYSNGIIKSTQLYDLLLDPFEKTDLSKENPYILEEYTKQLELWRGSVYVTAQEVGCLPVSKDSECKCFKK